MGAVLLGRVSALETLFPGGSPELAHHLYERSPGTRYANAIAAAAVRSASLAMPPGRKLRILEIGGGTGGFTSSVLPLLSSRQVSYRFTDVSEQFLTWAATRFAGTSFLRYGVFDIENENHLSAHRSSCDVLIAANVVHATRDLHRTLEGLRGLVVPGGTVILLESTRSLAWHEITIGLIQGWEKSEDEVRHGATLLSAGEWEEALRAAGFVGTARVPESGSPAEVVGLHVLIAQAPFIVAQGQMKAPDDEDLDWHPASRWEGAVEELGQETAERLAQLPAAERREILLEAVLEEVAHVLRLGAAGAVGKRDRLMEIGLDSLMAMELSRNLSRRTRLAEMPATLMFDYPTPEAIVEYLLRRMEGDGCEGTANEAAMVPAGGKALLTGEEVDAMSDDAVAELLRSRVER